MKHNSFSVAVIAAVVCALAVPAVAKPKLAVLGLDVVTDRPDGLDVDAAEFAKALTDALRKRAKTPDARSPYVLGPNTNKRLAELKLVHGCMSEGRKCMAAIGRTLAVDFMLYGKVERQQSRGVYRVTLKLLDVGEPRNIKTFPGAEIPLDDVVGDRLGGWARRLYNRIAGVPNEGRLIVRVANTDVGRVFLDGKPITGLDDGVATMSGLPEGKHDVRVKADGFADYEASVAVVAGEDAELALTLVPLSGPPETASRPGGAYRTLFYASAAVAIASGLAWGYSVTQIGAAEDVVAQYGGAMPTKQIDEQMIEEELRDAFFTDVCAIRDSRMTFAAGSNEEELLDACDKGVTHSSLSVVFGASMVVGVGAAAISFYKGFVATGGASAKANGAASARLQITPVASPSYAGAAVRLAF